MPASLKRKGSKAAKTKGKKLAEAPTPPVTNDPTVTAQDAASLAKAYGTGNINAATALAKTVAGQPLGRIQTGTAGIDAATARAAQLSNQGLDPSVQKALDAQMALTQGYTGPEYQAMQEQMARGINSQYATQQRELLKTQARSGASGGASAAALRNLARQRAQEQGNLEQDLYIRGVENKQNQTNQYLQNVAGIRSDLTQSQINAAQMQGQTAAEAGRQLTDQQKLNLGQEAAERSAYGQAFIGGLGRGDAEAARKSAESLTRQGISAVTGRGAKRSGSSSARRRAQSSSRRK